MCSTTNIPTSAWPHTASVIHTLRTFQGDKNPMFISEYGVGSAVDLWRVTRHYERLGKEHVEDAQFYRDKLDRFPRRLGPLEDGRVFCHTRRSFSPRASGRWRRNDCMD